MSLHHYTRNECLNTIIHTDNIHASSGNESGLKTIHEFGHNLNVDTNYKTLWSVGTTYSYLSSATILKISSSDTNDDDGDNGARTVLVQGLDTHYNEIEEIVTLDGQNAVNTSKKYLRVFDNEGIIYAGTGTITLGVPANIYAEIPAQYNQTMMAVYTIPNNKTGYMTLFYAQPDDSKGFQTQLKYLQMSLVYLE
jgi:uncharacterized protein YrzB (UPF0473 family)